MGKKKFIGSTFFVDTISEEALQRVCRIFDVFIKALESLECKLTDDLKIKVNQKIVHISATEAKDKIPHTPTEKKIWNS